MKRLLLVSFFLIAVGCSSDEMEESSQELAASSNFELSENIIGKWDIQNTGKNVATCRIFNIVFSQNEFTINYTGGQIVGTYTVDSETEISLNSTGNITNILISNNNISLNISIDGCEINANGVKDNNYNDGDCLTFLECLDGVYFSEDGEIDDFVVGFFNEPNETWYLQYFFNSNCYEIENPFNSQSISGYSVELIQNSKDLLIVKTIDGNNTDYFKLVSFDDGSLSVSFSNSLDGEYEIDNDYISITQAKVFELQSILESLNECNTDIQSIECSYNGQTDSGETITGTWVAPLLDDFLINTSVNGRNGRLEILPEGINDNGYEYKWEFQPEGSEEIIEINRNSNLLIPSTAQEIPSNISTTGLYTVYVYESGNTEGCAPFRAQISITLQVSTYVPDDNFEQYLIDNGYDDILDDYVLTDNIIDVEEINYLHGGIESLEGIQDFTNLKRLALFNYPDFVTQVNDADLQQRIDADLKNNIQFADLSNNKKLVYISLGRNIALESININGLTELIGLTLEGCQNLSSTDFSTNTKLEWLNLGFNNKITEIDLTNLLELGRLHLRATGNLNSLDISNNSKIVDLDTQYTNLECIKVSDYQIQNQINSNSIDGESSFTVWFSDTSGQVFDVNWEKDSDTIYSTDCN